MNHSDGALLIDRATWKKCEWYETAAFRVPISLRNASSLCKSCTVTHTPLCMIAWKIAMWSSIAQPRRKRPKEERLKGVIEIHRDTGVDRDGRHIWKERPRVRQKDRSKNHGGMWKMALQHIILSFLHCGDMRINARLQLPSLFIFSPLFSLCLYFAIIPQGYMLPIPWLWNYSSSLLFHF